MKKIMFNDKYGLTQAVLEGRKTMTRRNTDLYEVGEVVAIAQNYEQAHLDMNEQQREELTYADMKHLFYRKKKLPGFKNKMFVKAEWMPHHIRILSKRQEGLATIGNGDCMREGIREIDTPVSVAYTNGFMSFAKPRDAFKDLIDRLNKRGFFESNPLVWVYEFELID